MKTTAHAILLDNEDGDEWHELVYWPIDHECAPSATSHLARIFTDQCYAAVEADPTKSVFQIWKDVRTDIGQHLTSENRESCLEPDQVPLNIRQSLRSLPIMTHNSHSYLQRIKVVW